MPQGLVQPSNKILHSGFPVYREYEVRTAGGCYPGRLVQHDTNEWDVKVAESGSAVVLGVLDVEPTELRTTIYGTGDQARVITGDCVVLLKAVSGATIDEGTLVQAGDSGMVIESTDATKAVGKALQVKTGITAAWILVKLTLV